MQKKLFKIGFILVIIFISNIDDAYSQLKKANDYFDQKNYKESIPYYLKALQKDSLNKQATQNIAFSYRKLKDTKNAEIYFSKAIKLNPNESSNNLYYGQALKTNGKIKKAQIQFQNFINKNPTSLIGKLMIESCSDILEWETKEKKYEVALVENINSIDADFCPIQFNQGIVFISERGINLIHKNDPEFTDEPYLSIFYAKENNQYKKSKNFSNQINSAYHDGPVSISKDNQTIYFTRSNKKERGKNHVNRPKIYSATLVGNRWKDITPFIHNNSDYSVAHPAISEDNKKLFFSSDMPGGYGEMDLYVCYLGENGWGEPINLGKEVNSSKNEVFPYYNDETLYFSSNGHSGYGGLDLYAVSESNKWEAPVNLKAPINSFKDDFGIFYLDDQSGGYFSSNRDGGVGKDDIYRFKKLERQKTTSITGILEFEPSKNIGSSLNLLDDNNNIVGTVKTDSEGRFRFDKLELDKQYLLEIDEKDDNNSSNNSKLYFTNSNGEKVLLLNRNKEGKYKFETLPYERYDELEIIDKDESLFTIKIFGQVYQKIPGDFNNQMEIWMVDDEGNIIKKTTSDASGRFLFDKLTPDNQYMFMLPENDKGLKVIIVDKDGKVLESATKLANGRYHYVRLNTDENVIALLNEDDQIIKISENENFVLSKILYEYRSSEINDKAAKELDKLILILNKNKDIGVKLSSHTDSKGSDPFNMRLSQERADNVVKYITTKGKVSKNKVKAKGYGETRPIAPNNLPNGKDNPEGRSKNRRTEVSLIKLNN